MSEETDDFEPMRAEKTVRQQLELYVRDRFKYDYDPMIVFADGEWHYPLTAEETICGKEIPDPVPATKQGEWSGPSTKSCKACRPSPGSPSNRDLRRRIVGMLPTGDTNTNGFDKSALLAIVESLEERERRERGLSE
jgi:hypothetical protein